MTSSTATHQRTELSTGCCSGHGGCEGSAVGLPNKVRVAAATALIGLYSATWRSGSGSEPTGTNVLATNVSGNMTMKATPVTASGVLASRPIHIPTQSIVKANRAS